MSRIVSMEVDFDSIKQALSRWEVVPADTTQTESTDP